MFTTEAAGSPRPLPSAFLPEETEDMATWVQHVLSADGWETAPALASARPSSLAVQRPLLQRGTQVSTVKAEGDPIEDIWQALKKGKRPGTDPGQCNPNGRLTTEASLCMWLTGLSDGEKYGLISQAVSDAPLCLEGLEAVLQLGWYDMNTYIQTSTGMFSPAALVLCNHGGGSESSGSAVVGALRMLLDAGADLKRPAVLSFELDPLESLVHLAVQYGHSSDVLLFLRGVGIDLDIAAHESWGRTAAWEAVVHKNLDLLKVLLEMGASLPRDAVHRASHGGHVEMVRYLLQLGMPPDSLSNPTPMQLASKKGHLEVVRLLHASGADVRRCNAVGASPFSIAFRAGHATVVSYLRSCGIREDNLERQYPNGPTWTAKPQQKRKKRTTPMRERARRAGVLDRLRDSPPGARERAQNGSASAKKELQAIHKHNHQVVDRAEVAAHPERLELDCRRKADASSHRKRSLAL